MKKEGRVSSPFTSRRNEAREQLPAEIREERYGDLHDIENLEYSIDRIFKKLAPEINRGDFTLIIGDDASGRIPTFIIAHALKTIYKKKRFQPPSVRFIAGSTQLNDSERHAKIEKVAAQIGKMKETLIKAHGAMGKTLVVTEIVESGASLKVLLDGLFQNHMDVQAVSLGESRRHKNILTEAQVNNLVVGDPEDPPLIYGKQELSGVQKNPDDLFATPAKGIDQNMPLAARAVAMQVAQNVVTTYLQENP